MIDGRGRAMIMDLGVARSAGEETTGAVAGTPAYMPPEQLAGGSLSVQTDLYALGPVMFEMFTGQCARGAGAASESLSDARGGEPPPPSRPRPGTGPKIRTGIPARLGRDNAD